MIGRTISHCKILERFGKGGLDDVFKVEDTRLSRIVALKFLKAGALEDEDARKRFIQEARATAALDHSDVRVSFAAARSRCILWGGSNEVVRSH